MQPEEEAKLKELKDMMQNGSPIDESHPGFQNLSPIQ